MSDELRRLREQTRATPDAAARVKKGTSGELSPEDLKALLRTVPSAPAGAAARVKERVAEVRPRSGRPWLRAGVAGLVGALLVGGTIVGGALVGTGLAPDTLGLDGIGLRGDAPVSLDVGLGQHIVVDDLTLDAHGHGTLSGTRAAPRLDWQEGRARVDAADLLIATREAEVRVARQALALDRDVTGTIVEAERGTLAVRCLADDATHTLSPGATITCPPVSLEGMLNLARSEHEAGTPAAAVLRTVEVAATRPATVDSPLPALELAVFRMQLLAEDGRPRAALDEARAWLATGTTHRRAEVERFAAALALTHEGCDGARPHLEALAPTSLDVALRLAACTPDRAAQVLDAAAPLAQTPEDHAALATTRSQLGVP